MRPHRGTVRVHVGATIAAVLLLGIGPVGATPPDTDLIEVIARTLVIGSAGRRIAERDRAVLAPDKAGLLRVTVELADGESVTLELKVRYTLEPGEGAEADAPTTVRLKINSTARARPSGGTVMRSGGGIVVLPGSLLHEVFVSPSSGERVVINLEAVPWREPGPLLPTGSPPEVRPVSYRISIYRKTAAGLDFLGMPVLHSLVGRSVSYGFGFTLGEPGDPESTGEVLELQVHAIQLRDGTLTGKMTLEGDLRGQQVRASRGWSLRSGEQEVLSFGFGEIAGEEREGVIVLEAVF